VIYGDTDIEEKLAFIDREYLSKVSRTGNHVEIQRQAPVVNEKTSVYAIGAEEEEKDNAYSMMGWCIGDYTDSERMMAFQIINSVLLSTNESPLKKAILATGLVQDVSGEVFSDVLQPAYTITLQKTNAPSVKQIEAVVYETLEQIASEGFDKKALLAAVNHMEFKLRENETGGFPKGILYALNIFASTVYGGDPLLYLTYEEEIKHLRDGIETGYYESLIREFILGSKHKALVTCVPSKTLFEEVKKRDEEKLASYKASLSEEELEELIRMNEELAAFQSSEDTPEQLATLPKLSIDDLTMKAEKLPTEIIDSDGRRLLFHEQKTGGIAYLTFYYNIGKIALEDLPAVSAYASMLGKLPTEHFSAMDLNTEAKLYFGDFAFGVRVYAKDTKYCMPLLTASVSVLDGNVSKAVEMVREVLFTTKAETDATASLLAQITADMQMSIIQGGHVRALGMVGARLASGAVYTEQISGVAYYRALQNMSAESLIEKIASLELFRALTVSLTGDASAKEELISLLPLLEKSEGAKDYVSAPLATGNPAITIPAGVSYVSKGATGFKGQFKEGVLKVFEQILRLDYLWNEVRAKGGAYGVGVAAEDDLIRFYSYRDPNVARTLDAYDGAEEYLNAFEATDETLTGYIIGTMAGLTRPISAKGKGNKADAQYFCEIPEGKEQRVMDEVIATTVADVKDVARLIRMVKEQNVVAVVGSGDKIAESGAFDPVEAL
ncbi:MAG: insulinase family protein, partial [Christensenellaceae bacterium]